MFTTAVQFQEYKTGLLCVDNVSQKEVMQPATSTYALMELEETGWRNWWESGFISILPPSSNISEMRHAAPPPPGQRILIECVCKCTLSDVNADFCGGGGFAGGQLQDGGGPLKAMLGA